MVYSGSREEKECPLDESFPLILYLSCEWKGTRRIHFQCLYLSSSGETSVSQMWMGRVVCIGISLAGALGLEHTQLWVTDACSPVLMWPACETMASAMLHKGPFDSLGSTPQLKKFSLKAGNTL